MTGRLSKLLCFAALFVAQFSFSQVGTEFWLAPPEATSGHVTDTPPLLRISTGTEAATVTISMPANGSFTPIVVNIGANSAHTENLAAYKELLETKPMDAVLNTGLRLQSTAPITVYYELNTNNNPDIWALKGPNSLGNEFYVPFQQRYRNGNYSPEPYTSFDIVATEDNTTILIFPSKNLFGGHPAFQSYSITLNSGQTYSGGVYSTNGADNPAGTIIVANKPVAVSTKDDSVWLQDDGGCRDMNGDQLVPVSIVGREYIVVRGGLENEEYAYVTATANNTELYIDGVLVANLFNGENYELLMDSPTKLIETSKPAYVIHMSGFGCETGTALLPPLNCAGSEQVFFTRSTNETFILTILVPTDAEDAFVLNGNANLIVAADFNVVPGTDGQWMYAYKSFSTSQIPVNTAQLLTNSKEVFSMGIINGGAGSGCRYGYFSEFASEILVEAGNNQIVCANDTVQLNGTVEGGATAGMWTSNGTGAFIPDEYALNAQYIYSIDDIANGQVTFTLTSVSNCFPVEDDLTVSIPPAPIVNAGNDITTCINNPVTPLNGAVTFAAGGQWSGGDGDFSPNDLTLNATYTPSAAELQAGQVTLSLTSIGNGTCYAESDEITIIFSPEPEVNAGADQTYCANNAVVILNGSVSGAEGGVWSGGGGSWDPAPSALNVAYEPTAAELATGSVNLTLTSTGNGNCVAESDIVQITFTPAPNVNAGIDAFVCANDADVQLNGSVTVANGGQWSGGLGSFSPNSTTLNAIYSPAATEITNGQVTLTLTSTDNANCVSETDVMTIFIGPAPVANAGPNQTVCQNNPQVDLNGTIANAGGGQWSGGAGTFFPSSTSWNATYMPTEAEAASESLTLTFTSTGNGNCQPVSDQMTINFTPAPQVNAGLDQTYCANNAVIQLNGSVSVASGGTWTGGNGNFSPHINALNAVYTPTIQEIENGSVTLTLTSTGNLNCFAESDEVTFTFTPAPTANAGNDISVCSNNPQIPLNGIVTVASGGVWSGGNGTYSTSPTDLNTIYTPTQNEINSGSLILTLTTSNNGNCLAVTDEIEITFTPSPTADAGDPISVCTNNPEVYLNGQITIAGGGAWSGGNGNFTPNANTLNAVYTPTEAEIANGSLNLTLTTTQNENCAAVSDVLTVTFTPSPTANAGQDVTVCDNTPDVELNGSVTIATGGTWSGGSGTFTPDNNTMDAIYTPSTDEIAAGTVTLTLTTTGNSTCLPENDTMTITINEGPQVNAGTDEAICSNNPDIQLNGTIQFASGAVWSGGLGLFTPSATDLDAVYTPTQTEINSGSITLTLTSTGNGNCLASVDEVTFNFTPSPVANAGNDRIVCANAAEVELSGVVSVATGGIWSGGNGTFTPSNTTLNATYLPSPEEILNGAVTLTLTTTENGNCNPHADEMIIIITQAPTANAGTDRTVCANNAEVQLNGSVTIANGGIWSGGDGMFTPSNTDLAATYLPSAEEIAAGTVTLTLTTTGNGLCVPVEDEMTITITPAPVVNAGSDQAVCSNNPEISLNGSVSIVSGGQWSGGLGTFSPNANTLNATYIPTQSEINSGSITLTLTSTENGNCLPVSDETTIEFTPTPTVEAGPSEIVCANNADVQLNGSVSIANGGTWSGGSGTFTPNADVLDAIYTPSATEIANGSVQLTLTTTGNGNCIAVNDVMTITITPAPVINAGADITVCANNPEVELDGVYSVATGAEWSGGNGTFIPGENDPKAEYIPSAAEIAAGQVTLTLTSTGNGNCLSVSDQVVITITPAPVVNAGADQTLCNNNATAQLNGSVTIASGGQWSGGLGSFAPSSTALDAQYTPSAAELITGSVTLTLTSTGNEDCVAESDQVTIFFTDAPIVDAGTNLNSCANNPMVTLNGFVSAEAAGGEWTGGSGTFSPNNFSLSASYTPSATEIANGSVTLTLTSVGNGNCMPVSDEVTINIAPAPIAHAGNNQTVCSNNPQITLSGSVENANGGIWSGGNGTFNPSATALNATYTPTPTELAAGTISLTLTTTGHESCIAHSDVMNINFTLAPTANAGDDIDACENNATVQLNGTVTVASGGMWTGGLGTFSPDNQTLNATYTPTQGEIAGGSVTLTLTTTNNGNCIAVSDQMTINYDQAPVVNAGADQTVCANNAAISLSGQVFGATDGVWSGGNGTFFPNVFNLNVTYTPTAAEIESGSVALTLTSAGNENCNAVEDVVIINFSPTPVVNAGSDAAICSNNADIPLNGSVTVAGGGMWSGGNGTFTPNNTTLNAIYTPTSTELNNGSVTLTLISTENGNCIAVSDQVTYTFTPSPTANAGVDQSICANNPNIELNGAVTVATGGQWSGGLGSFSPSANDLNAVYTPTQSEINAGTLHLTLTTTENGNCVAAMDIVTIEFTPAPTADAGSNITVCANNPQATLNGSISIASGGIWTGGNGTFAPANTTLDATYTPTADEIAAGSVTLTLTTTDNNNCTAVSDEVTITITPAPVVNAGSDAVVCANNPTLTLAGAVSNAPGGIWSGGDGSFSPGNSSLGAIYTPTAAEIAAGTVTLTLTSTAIGNCNPVSDEMTITINPAPVVLAGNDQTLCQNNPTAALNGNVIGADGGMWSGGTGSFSPNATTPNATYTPSVSELLSGSVTLTLTSTGNGNCLSESDEVTLFFTPAPTANAGSNFSVCANNPEFQLSGAVTVAAGGEWSGGNGTFNPNHFTLNATYLPTPDEIAAGSLTLTLTTSGNENCNEVSDQVTITFNPAPVANAGPDLISCENNPTVTLLGNISNAEGGIWSGGNGTFNPANTSIGASYTPTAAEVLSGSVTLTLTTTGFGDCFPVSDVMTISYTDSPTIDAGSDQVICSNNPLTQLNGFITGADGGIWSGGQGTFSPSTSALNATYLPSAGEINNGSVTLTLTSTGNGSCLAVVDEITIVFTAPPTANAGPNQVVCSNNPATQLSGVVSIAGSGTWSGGNGIFWPDANTLNAVYTPTAAEIASGQITLTLTTTDNGNCIAVSDQMNISFSPSPSVNAGNDITVCANNPEANLNGNITIASGGVWSGGNGTFSPSNESLGATYTPTLAEIANGSVTLTLTSTGNESCHPESDTVTIHFSPAPTANAGPDLTTCANNPSAQLNGAVTVASGGSWSGGNGTFLPAGNVLNPVYIPTQGEINNGSVTLTLTSTGNAGCSPVSDNITITFDDAPTADAGANIIVCANNPLVALSGSVTVATDGVWSGGSGMFNPGSDALNATYTPTAEEIAAGSLVLTLTTTGNGDCNSVSDDVLITFSPSPTANAGTDLFACENNPSVSLSGTVTVAIGGIWSGGNGDFLPDAFALNATYIPTASEIAAGSVTLTLTSTENGDCMAVSDEVTITFTDSATADAGADIVVCENNPVATLNGSVTVATGGVWSGGLGSFSPAANVLNATYTPSQAEINNGSVTLTLTTTGFGNCTPVSDSVTISFSESPTANAGNNQSRCENNPSVPLNGVVTIAAGGIWSGGNGTFDPGPDAPNAIYTPTQAEIDSGEVVLVLTTTGNGDCIAVSDDMLVMFTPAPTVNAGPDKTACANNAAIAVSAVITGASNVIWTGGSGTFEPDNISLNTIYYPTAAEIAAGTVTLTATTSGNGNCLPESDQMLITITPAVEADAGANQVLCANNAQIQLNGSVSIASGGVWSGGLGTFTPSATSPNALYTPTAGEIASGSLTLTFTTTGNGQCLPEADTATFTFTPAPTADAGTNAVVCANNPEVSLNGEVTIASGGIWSGGNGTFTPAPDALNATYLPSADEIVAGGVTLTLTTTDNGNCLAVSDQMNISITPAPVVNAGATQTICANNADVVLNGSITVASGGKWTGGNGTFFPNDSTLNAVYSPTANEIANGSVALTLTSFGNGNCLSESDVVTINFTPAPTVEAGMDQEICANNPLVSLAGAVTHADGGQWSGGQGSFSPNANNLNATYSPTQSEINAGSVVLTLTTTGIGNCIAATDSLTIVFTPSPTVNAGANAAVCANNPEVSLDGAVTIATGGTWSGGEGSFSPSAEDLNAVYTPTQDEIGAGSVTLTLTTTGNGNCIAVSDQITITITPAPTAHAGTIITVCENSPVAQLNGSVTIASGGIWSGGEGMFNPSNTTLNAEYTPSANEIAVGTVTLTLTTTGNGNCLEVSDQVVINIPEAPVVMAGSDQTLCANNPYAQLSGTILNAGGGQWSGGLGSFTPSPTDPNAVYSPTQTEINNGFVTLTLTSTGNGTCLPESDMVIINYTPAPTVDAGANQTVCANNAEVQLNGQITIATGGLWSGGNGTFTPEASALNAIYTPSTDEIAAGSFTLTLTTTGNGNCIAVSDEMTVNITSAPTVNAGPDRFSCANNPQVTITGTISGANGGIWSGGGGTFDPSDDVLSISYTPSADEIAAGSVTLNLTSTGNGLCNPESDEVSIFIDPSPVVEVGDAVIVCANNNEVALNGSVDFASGGIWSGGSGSYDPSPEDLNAVYTPSAAEIANGGLTLTLTSTGNGTCLPETEVLQITITPAPTANAGADQTFCADLTNIPLNGAASIAEGALWSGGNGTFSPSANDLNAVYTPTFAEISNGTVILTLTTIGNGDCSAVSDEVTFTFQPVPFVNAGPDIEACANNAEISLGGIFFNADGVVWSGGLGTFIPSNTVPNATYIPSQAEILSGGLTLTLTTTGNGVCEARQDQLNITINPGPVVNAGNDIVVCANNADAQLNGSVTNAGGAIWAGGDGFFIPGPAVLNAIYSPTADEIANGSVTLTLTSTGNGDCLPETDEVVIIYTVAPVVDAGTTVTVCENNTEAQLNGTINGATGGIWSGGNGNFIPDNTTLNAVYLPTPDEIVAGSVQLTLTSTGNGDCLPVEDQMTITIDPSPIVDAGLDILTCVTELEVQLSGSVVGTTTTGVWTTTGTGFFVPSPTDLNAVYHISTSDSLAGTIQLALTSTNNGACLAVSDTIAVTVLPPGIANAGNDEAVCANNPQVALNGSIDGEATSGIWSTSGDGIFIPNSTALNATYLPGDGDITAGEVVLTLTANSCDAAQDNLTITITPAPVVTAGIDVTVCVDDMEVQLNGSVSGASTTGIWTTSGTGIFVPDNTTLNAIYIPSSQDSLNLGVTLTLSASNIGNCIAVSDQIAIVILPEGFANAGVDIEICSNEGEVPLNGIISGAASEGSWTTTGTGTFVPNATTLDAIYIPSEEDVANGSVSLILTTTNSCNASSDFMNLTITPGPVANAGTNIAVCEAVFEFELNGSVGYAVGGIWSTSGSGTFSDSIALNTTYFASEDDLANGMVIITLTTTGNGDCEADVDQLTIIVTEGIVADAGADQTVCIHATETQLQGAVSNGSVTGYWTTSGDGTFLPDSSALDAVYVFAPSDTTGGSIVLTLTSTNNGVCEPALDQVVITFGDAPFVDAGGDFEICADHLVAPLSGFITGGATQGVWSTSGTGTFEPDDTNLDAVYIVSEADALAGAVTITLTSTDQDLCDAGSDSVVLTILPTPVVNAGNNLVICDPSEQIVLNGTVSNATGGYWSTAGTGTFLPDSSALNVLYIPGDADIATGSVTLTLTSTGNGLCDAVSDEVTIQIGVELIADAGEDLTICADISEVPLTGNVGGDATTGSWSTSGDGTFNPSADSLDAAYLPGPQDLLNGQVILTLSTTNNSGCPAATDFVTITFEPVAIVEAGDDINFCGTLAAVDLTPTLENTTAVIWTTSGSGSFDPDPFTTNASYMPTESDSLSGSVVLTLTSNNQGVCAEVSDALTVTFNPMPTANAGVDFMHCNDNLEITLDGMVNQASGGTWSTSGTGTFDPDVNTLNATYIASAVDSLTGSVTLTLTTVSDSPCEQGSDSVTITFEAAPQADAGADIVTCGSNNEVMLDATVSNTTGITWVSSGTGTFQPNANTVDAIYILSEDDVANGGVVLTITTIEGMVCAAATDQMEIIISNPLIAHFDVSNACVGQAVQFTDETMVLSGSIQSWHWDFGNGTSSPLQHPTSTYTQPGSYNVTLTVTSSDGCSDVVSMLVEISEVPIAGFSVTAMDNEGTFSFTDESIGGSSWSWDFGDDIGSSTVQNPAYQYSEDGLYTVTQYVTNEFGCMDSTQVVIRYEGQRVLPPKMPNAFSPNGDGNNDVYYVLGGPFESLEFKVYNGWGELMFTSTAQENGWDGTFRGQPVQVGAYVYTVKATTIEGETYEKSGKISLIR